MCPKQPQFTLKADIRIITFELLCGEIFVTRLVIKNPVAISAGTGFV